MRGGDLLLSLRLFHLPHSFSLSSPVHCRFRERASYSFYHDCPATINLGYAPCVWMCKFERALNLIRPTHTPTTYLPRNNILRRDLRQISYISRGQDVLRFGPLYGCNPCIPARPSRSTAFPDHYRSPIISRTFLPRGKAPLLFAPLPTIVAHFSPVAEHQPRPGRARSRRRSRARRSADSLLQTRERRRSGSLARGKETCRCRTAECSGARSALP